MSKVELIDKNELWAKRHAVDDYGRKPYVVDAEDVFYAEVVQAIPLAKVKQAREKIRKLDDINPDYPMDRTIHVSRNEVLAILDKLIESEEK